MSNTKTATEKQIALMGQPVTVTKIYQRGLSKSGVRQWVEVEQAPATGWIVGFRTIWDGYVDYDTGEYGQRESSNYFVPTGHHECVLVVFSPRHKPFNVPLDGFAMISTPDERHCQNATEIVQRDILSTAVSEAAYILSNLIEMDNTGLVFVTSADGKVLERAVAFLEAARSEE